MVNGPFGILQRLFGERQQAANNQNQNQMPEDMTTTQDSGPVRRTIGCRIQVVAVLEGRGDLENIDLSSVEDALGSSDDVDRSFNVNVRDARIEGDGELLLVTRGSILSEDQLENAVAVARNDLLNQPVGLTINSWRVEAV